MFLRSVEEIATKSCKCLADHNRKSSQRLWEKGNWSKRYSILHRKLCAQCFSVDEVGGRPRTSEIKNCCYHSQKKSEAPHAEGNVDKAKCSCNAG